LDDYLAQLHDVAAAADDAVDERAEGVIDLRQVVGEEPGGGAVKTAGWY
jgi:hypothetical protein